MLVEVLVNLWHLLEQNFLQAGYLNLVAKNNCITVIIAVLLHTTPTAVNITCGCSDMMQRYKILDHCEVQPKEFDISMASLSLMFPHVFCPSYPLISRVTFVDFVDVPLSEVCKDCRSP